MITDAPSTTPTMTPTPPLTGGDIRLVGGSSTRSGRVEISINGVWGTVCGRGWGQYEAQVVCRQQGFNVSNTVLQYNAYFGQGTGPVHFNKGLDCLGTETKLIFCPRNSSYSSCSSHRYDVGVVCGNIFLIALLYAYERMLYMDE